MTKALWLRFYSGDWLNETRFLSAVECGIYINLVAMMHDAGGPIPDDPDELMRGLDRYVAGKPPDRPWCNPSTWLNQDRHADEPAPPSTALVNGGRNGFGNRSRQPIDWERHAREFASDFARLNDRDPYGSDR